MNEGLTKQGSWEPGKQGSWEPGKQLTREAFRVMLQLNDGLVLDNWSMFRMSLRDVLA